MSKILLVFGATGKQGGSVISYILSHSSLSKGFSIRGISRDTDGARAKELTQMGVEMVKADIDDAQSIANAMNGVHTTFIMTSSNREIGVEAVQGKALADAAVLAGVQYIIFSTIPSIRTISQGKYTGAYSYDEKFAVEQYIRGLPIKSAFFAPGSFASNFQGVMAPKASEDGSGFVLRNVCSANTKLPIIDEREDTGKYVGAILNQPTTHEGKVLYGASKVYTYHDICRIMTQFTGKTVTYEQLPSDFYHQIMPAHLADYYAQMFLSIQDFGYYGPKTERLVQWSNEQIEGIPKTLEEFLQTHQLIL